MNQGLTQSHVQATNDLYMYKFRTNLCSEKRWCTNPSGCFDAHSNIMKRRVPKWMKSGRFNYVPEACPEWRISKRCFMGKNCPRSHGWLEIIFHPLLYKTKLCTAPRQNGVCSQYGVYCAKAHTRSEIRSLVNIYGENWKTHYEISDRLKVKSSRRTRATTAMVGSHKRKTSGMMKNQKRKIDRVGIAVPQKNRYILNVNEFAKYLLDTHDSQLKQQQIWPEPSEDDQLSTDSDVSFEDWSSCDEEFKCGNSGLLLSKEKITSYTQLYSTHHTFDKEVEDGSPKHEVAGSACQKEEKSQSTTNPAEDIQMTSCGSIISLLDDELECKLSLDGIDWGNCLYCVGDSLGRGNEVMCERVSQN